jgi:hypothetical protein
MTARESAGGGVARGDFDESDAAGAASASGGWSGLGEVLAHAARAIDTVAARRALIKRVAFTLDSATPWSLSATVAAHVDYSDRFLGRGECRADDACVRAQGSYHQARLAVQFVHELFRLFGDPAAQHDQVRP